MRLDRKSLRRMILAEMKTSLMTEQSSAKEIADQIAETYGDMFEKEGYIDAQIENHVYLELIDQGHMSEAAPDFDLLDAVMEHLSVRGVVSEGVLNESDVIRPIAQTMADKLSAGDTDVMTWFRTEHGSHTKDIKQIMALAKAIMKGGLEAHVKDLLSDFLGSPEGLEILSRFVRSSDNRDLKPLAKLGRLTTMLFSAAGDPLAGVKPEEIRKHLASQIPDEFEQLRSELSLVTESHSRSRSLAEILF